MWVWQKKELLPACGPLPDALRMAQNPSRGLLVAKMGLPETPEMAREKSEKKF